MSQHSMSVAGGVGVNHATVRTGFNSGLQALASQSSGATEPGTRYPYQIWADTTAGVRKRRNAANNAWVLDSGLAEVSTVTRTSNTQLTTADFGKMVLGSGTWTQTFAAAATLGDGWWVTFKNDGADIITLDPNASETIDGATTMRLHPGAECTIQCNGASFRSYSNARYTRDGVTPASVAAKNVLWQFPDGGNSKNVLMSNGTRGGFFSDYDSNAAIAHFYQLREDQSAISGGGFRELMFLNLIDNDVVNYDAIGQKVSFGLRVYVNGAHNGAAYQSQYKDLVGGSFAAIGNIQTDARGVSAVTADSIQYGAGIASHEFLVRNPAAASGGISQSKSMAALQAIVENQFAAEDGTHLSRGLYVSSHGHRITSGLELLSDTSGGWASEFKFGLRMAQAVVTGAGIVMPTSGVGASIIEYGANIYSSYISGQGFAWTIGGLTPVMAGARGLILLNVAGTPGNSNLYSDGVNLFWKGSTGTVTQLN